jgi:hypothetical protein
MDTKTTIGHNNPPPDLLIGDRLRESLRDQFGSLIDQRDRLVAMANRVPEIDNDPLATIVADRIKEITALTKTIEASRIAVKEPYLEGGRGIDGFFKGIDTPLIAAKRAVEANLTRYLRAKADRERREREERERLAREEERKRREEAEAAAQKIRDGQTLADAIEAERQANVASAGASRAEAETQVNAAALSRTRSERGAVASLRTNWTFRDLDRTQIDLEMLRPHLPEAAMEAAVRSFIKAGGRTLTGVVIFETTDAVVR